MNPTLAAENAPRVVILLDEVPALLARAEQCVAAQREAYGTELDEDRAWRCAWDTWKTLQAVIPHLRALATPPPQPPAPAAGAVRHLRAVQAA